MATPAPQDPLVCLMLVSFHHKLGPHVEFVYPALPGQSPPAQDTAYEEILKSNPDMAHKFTLRMAQQTEATLRMGAHSVSVLT